MTKMATIPIDCKKNLLCPVTVLVDSQVSDRCPWATVLNFDPNIDCGSVVLSVRTVHLF